MKNVYMRGGRVLELLPTDYYLIEEDEKNLIFAIGFSQMMEEAHPFIIYNGKHYRRGPIEALTSELAGHFCSVRRYEFAQELKLSDKMQEGIDILAEGRSFNATVAKMALSSNMTRTTALTFYSVVHDRATKLLRDISKS